MIVSEDAAERSRYAKVLVSEPPAAGISYEITTVGSVAAAQLQVTRQRFHLVIVALSQQDDGLELSSRLKDLFPDMRLLLLCEQGVTKSQLKTARLIRASVAESTIDVRSLRAIVADMLGASAMAQKYPPPQGKPADHAEAAIPSINRRSLPEVIKPFLLPFLEELRRQTRSHIAVYTDKDGVVLGQDGEDPAIDVVAITRVLTRSCVQSLEVGTLLRDPGTIHLSVHEGRYYDIYTANVRNDRFLLLFFNKDFANPKLGLIFLLMKRSAEQLGRIN
ncbi:MAG: hypothetical protein HC884_00030 [Chloroflexaceae bacterium]|nr:hypothetical protein [Chloroflexaceae bacterium]